MNDSKQSIPTLNEEDKPQNAFQVAIDGHVLFDPEQPLYVNILDRLTDGWWDWNLETNEEYLSPGFKALFGYEDHEIPNTVEGWQQLIFAEDFEIAKGNIEKHLATQGAHPYYQEVRYYHKNGQTKYVICRGQGIVEADGTIRRIVGTHTDITAIKQMAATLERANQELTQFAHVVAHDLRAPVRNIQSMIAWLNEDWPELSEQEINEKLATVGDRAQKIQDMINGILAYSRAGYCDAKLDTFTSQEIYQTIKEYYTENSDKVSIVFPQNNVSLTAPREMFLQIFLNLVGNAIKYSDKDHINIHITQEESESYYLFCVQDNGPGISEHVQRNMFKLFYTTANADNQQSSGLGLSLVRRFVVSFSGQVWCESKPGEGTSIFFTWPKQCSKSSN